MHGPRRVITFCLLTAVLPTVLLVIPLYLRHSVYADVSYEVTESDVLKMVEGISSIFCQEHSLKMNSTFSAFQLEKDPEVSPTRKHIHMKKSMVLPDDTLEYWGFYLLENSSVVLSVCSRFEGGRVMVVRGDRNLRTCGLLDHNTKSQGGSQQGGPGDKKALGGNKVRITFEKKPESRAENSQRSAEVSPVTTNLPVNHESANNFKAIVGEEETNAESKEVSIEDVKEGNEGEDGRDSEGEIRKEEEDKGQRKGVVGEAGDGDGSEEDDNSEEGEESFQGSGKGDAEVEGINRSHTEEELEILEMLNEAKGKNVDKGHKVLRHEKKRLRELKLKSKEFEDGDLERGGTRGGDEGGQSETVGKSLRLERLRRELGGGRHRVKREEVRLIDGGLKHGGTAINYTNRESEEDSNSSFEMGLMQCYGGDILFAQTFPPSHSCSKEVASEGTDLNSEEISKPSMRIVHDIISNGYYYYIFYSDNDRVMNEVNAAFDIHKIVYEYGSSKSGDAGVVCINATECTFPVGFLSGATVMVEVPTRDGIDRDVMDEKDGPQGAILISSCHPRMSVYIIFPVAVLFLILGCAFL